MRFMIFTFFLLQHVCCNVFGQTVTDTVFSDSFAGTALKNYWRVNKPTALLAVNDKLIVNGGDSSYTNFIEYNAKRVPFEKLRFSTVFVPQDKQFDSYGLTLFADSDSILYGSSLEVSLNLTNGSGGGVISIGYNHTIYAVSAPLFFLPGDTIDFSLERNGWVLQARAYNRANATTVSANLNSSTGRGSGGCWRLAFLGGEQHVLHTALTASRIQRPHAVVLGNSITTGAGATAQEKRYVNLLFSPHATSFETAAFPSVKSADVQKYLDEVIALQPRYAVLSLGVNDRNQFVDTSVFRTNLYTIVTRLQQNNIIPLLLTLVPSGIGWLENLSAGYNHVIQSLGEQQAVKVVDVHTALKNGASVLNSNYAADQVHPNDSGHLVMATIINYYAPELNNLTVLPFELVFFNARAQDRQVELNWIAANDDALFFDIERSINGRLFSRIASIPAGTNSQHYRFTDKDISEPELFYRLKIILKSGAAMYSSIVRAGLSKPFFRLSASPNPAQAYTVIHTGTGSEAASYTVRLYTAAGVAVDAPVQKGNGYLLLTTAGLPRGVYYVCFYRLQEQAQVIKLVLH